MKFGWGVSELWGGGVGLLRTVSREAPGTIKRRHYLTDSEDASTVLLYSQLFKDWTILGGKASFTYGPFFTDWGRFGHGAFWLESWAVWDIDVGRFSLYSVGRFSLIPHDWLNCGGRCGDGRFWYRPEYRHLPLTCPIAYTTSRDDYQRTGLIWAFS